MHYHYHYYYKVKATFLWWFLRLKGRHQKIGDFRVKQIDFSVFWKWAEKYFRVGMNSLGTLRGVYWEWLYSNSSSWCSLEATTFIFHERPAESWWLSSSWSGCFLRCSRFRMLSWPLLVQIFKVSSSINICFKSSQICPFIDLDRPPIWHLCVEEERKRAAV